MNKLFSLTIGLALLAGGLAGCSNTDGTTGLTQVSGQVLTYVGRQPVPGATVEVVDAHGGANSPIGVETTADAEGRFSFTFEAKKESGYVLLAYTPLGHFTYNSSAPQLTSGRRNADMVVPVAAPAWVRIHVVDETPVNKSIIIMQGYIDGGKPGGQSDELRFPRDTVLVRRLTAEEPTSGVAWWIYDQITGAETHDTKKLFIAPLDTVDLRIAF
jgi:hypothetical protein